MPDVGRRSSAAIAVAVFLAGAALLGLEIAASRVLAPYFGNSLYVWGALIGVVLAGLSTGYWVGGAIADRYPTPRLLVAMLAAGSLLVLAIPFVDEWVLEHLVEWDPGPRLNPLLATIFLFGVQSVVLGTISPIAVRLKAHSLTELGRTAGRLFAISTAGSIAGTFATAFWLIPELGTDQVLASAAVALMLAAAAVALVERLVVAGAVALALAGVSVGAVVSLAPEEGATVAASQLRNWSPVYRQQRDEERVGSPEEAQSGYTILHTKDSQYHRIAVVEDDDSRYLRFDSSFQSGMYKNDPFRTRFEYADYLQLPLAYRPETRRILYIGLGGGSAPKRTWRDFPATRIDAVEIDPEVVDVAYEYFELPRDPRLRGRGRGRTPLPRGQRGALGRDRGGRVLLGLDPVPPRHPRVSRAGALAARARRRRLDEHHRRRPRRRVAPLPLDAADVPRSLPDGGDPPRARGGRARPDRDQKRDPRRRRRGGPVEGVPPGAVG